MSGIAHSQAFIGLDYHKDSIQVCVLNAAGKVLGNRSVPNDVTAVIEFVEQAAGDIPLRCAAIEACCGSANFAEQLRTRLCSRMKQNPDKTDLSDAHLLSDLTRIGYLPRVWLPPQEVRDLRRLVRYRTQLAEQRRDRKLRIRALLREERIVPLAEHNGKLVGNVWTKSWLQWLRETTSLSNHSRWVMDQHL